jgi:uncharacterized protein (UPF0332 family)
MVETRWQQELPEIVAHTAYYAMYHAAIALLAKRRLSKPKTHSGLSARFAEYFRDVLSIFEMWSLTDANRCGDWGGPWNVGSSRITTLSIR